MNQTRKEAEKYSLSCGDKSIDKNWPMLELTKKKLGIFITTLSYMFKK